MHHRPHRPLYGHRNDIPDPVVEAGADAASVAAALHDLMLMEAALGVTFNDIALSRDGTGEARGRAPRQGGRSDVTVRIEHGRVRDVSRSQPHGPSGVIGHDTARALEDEDARYRWRCMERRRDWSPPRG